MARVRLTRRRQALLAAKIKAAAHVVTKIMPVLRSQQKRLERFLRRQNLRKRMMKIKPPQIGSYGIDAKGIALYKAMTLLKAPSPPSDRNEWEAWKKALLLALLLGLADGVPDIGDVENEAWTSRGLDPLTFDPEQIIQDYQLRVGRNLDDIGIDTLAGVENVIADWYMGDEPFADLLDHLDRYFDEARAEAIATTEVGNVMSQIFLQEMVSHGWGEWYWDALGENPCSNPITIKGMTYDGCIDLNGRKFKRGDPMPPDAAHPNCQCLPTPAL